MTYEILPARSPVFAHLSATLQGLTTIRAFGAQEILTIEFDNHQNLHSSAYYLFLGCSRSFGFWLDLKCVLYVGFVTISVLFIGSGESKFHGQHTLIFVILVCKGIHNNFDNMHS